MAAQASAVDRSAPAKEEQSPASTKEEQVPPTKEMLADRIIRENILWAAGGGLIPLPMLDMLAIIVVEVKMLRELAALYDVPFREDQVKSIIVSLLTGLGAPVVGAGIASMFKSVPFIGSIGGIVAVPGVAAAFTYAVGKVFLQHFASGGTFLDFDPKKVREHFAREFEDGKSAAAKVKAEPNPKADAPAKSA
jgi:uncharacterized protein (DUF697 family)